MQASRARGERPRFKAAQPKMLVLTPTRELAVQVADHVQGDRVETGGAIEGQVTDVVANLGQHFILRGIHGRSPLR